jgi:hypothetical protein
VQQSNNKAYALLKKQLDLSNPELVNYIKVQFVFYCKSKVVRDFNGTGLAVSLKRE